MGKQPACPGQQVHEKVLNITNHQGNANKNHKEISPHTCQDGYHQKGHKEQMLVRMWKKRKPSYAVGGKVNWCKHCGKQHGHFSKN